MRKSTSVDGQAVAVLQRRMARVAELPGLVIALAYQPRLGIAPTRAFVAALLPVEINAWVTTSGGRRFLAVSIVPLSFAPIAFSAPLVRVLWLYALDGRPRLDQRPINGDHWSVANRHPIELLKDTYRRVLCLL